MIAADRYDVAAGGRECVAELGQGRQCLPGAEHIPGQDNHGRVLRLHGRDNLLFQAAELA
jgi:hypothetical protein